MRRFPAINARIYNTPHLITPEKLETIAALIAAVERGDALAEREINARPRGFAVSTAGVEVALDKITPAGGDAFVAVLPLFGMLAQHVDDLEGSGGTSTADYGRQLAQLVANPSVRTIVLEVHSPGGQVYGTQELSDHIFAARKSGTRIVSAVNSEAASAALWIGTSPERVYVTPSGQMGSLGVVVMHRDYSAFEDRVGVKTTLLATPERKISGHPFAPLGDEAATELRDGIEKSYKRFVSAMARNRGVSEDRVRSDFGGGAMLRADEAVRAGLADEIATLRDVLAAEVDRLRPRPPAGNARANARALALAEASAELAGEA